MDAVRKIARVLKSKPTIEGAGVHLKRAFGYYEVPLLDPFLLLDEFHSGVPDDYMSGFPWHPHRGIETVTYMIKGEVEHGDSIGNEGLIGPGDIQWMTAGSGIIHQEMPRRQDAELWGFQLWANLPSTQKMTEPKYRDIKNDQVPEVRPEKNIKVKVICGQYGDVRGPVKDIVIEPEYLDVSMAPKLKFAHSTKMGHKVFAYIFEGAAYFDADKADLIEPEHLVIFNDGEAIEIETQDSSARFLLVSGKPIGEPVAWRGPVVMNTQVELQAAFDELQEETFIK